MPPAGIKKLGSIGIVGLFLLSIILFILASASIYLISDLIIFFVVKSILETLSSFFVVLLLLFLFRFCLTPLLILLFEESYLKLDRQSLLLIRKFFGKPISQSQCSNSDIHSVLVDKEGGNYRINLRSQTQSYFLDGAITEREAAWLSQEIRDWLHLR
jgi:hypothetical protein